MWAAIRSTADILAREPDLDPAWRGRFHRNLHQEAERLSARATGMLAYFEDQGANQGAFLTLVYYTHLTLPTNRGVEYFGGSVTYKNICVHGKYD